MLLCNHIAPFFTLLFNQAGDVNFFNLHGTIKKGKVELDKKVQETILMNQFHIFLMDRGGKSLMGIKVTIKAQIQKRPPEA